MLQHVLHLLGALGAWGYVVLFAGTTLECAALLGMIVPGETLVVLAGFIAQHGILKLAIVIPVAAAGAIIGDSIGYEAGRRLGHAWMERRGRRKAWRERLRRADTFFRRHGGKSVMFGRFIGFVRTVVPYLAGASKMRYGTFLLYNAAGGIAWAAGFALLGYFASASWHVLERWVSWTSLAVLGVVVAAGIVVWLRRRRRQPAH